MDLALVGGGGLVGVQDGVSSFCVPTGNFAGCYDTARQDAVVIPGDRCGRDSAHLRQVEVKRFPRNNYVN